MAQDCLYIRGVRGYGYTGALPEEQVLGQWFEVDLVLWLDLRAAAASDVLADTLDYGPLIQTIQELIQMARFSLVERLAGEIANQVLTYRFVQQVQVTVTKLTPPIPNFSGSIAVEITRQRDDAHHAEAVCKDAIVLEQMGDDGGEHSSSESASQLL